MRESTRMPVGSYNGGFWSIRSSSRLGSAKTVIAAGVGAAAGKLSRPGTRAALAVALSDLL